MSRIGKIPVIIPEGVEVTIDGQVVTAKGPLGTEVVTVRPEITVEKDGNTLVVTRANDDRRSRSLHGLSRTLIGNAVNGVKNGFTKKLEIVGVGYRAAMNGNTLNLALGYSHPVIVDAPEGVTTLKGYYEYVLGEAGFDMTKYTVTVNATTGIPTITEVEE